MSSNRRRNCSRSRSSARSTRSRRRTTSGCAPASCARSIRRPRARCRSWMPRSCCTRSIRQRPVRRTSTRSAHKSWPAASTTSTTCATWRPRRGRRLPRPSRPDRSITCSTHSPCAVPTATKPACRSRDTRWLRASRNRSTTDSSCSGCGSLLRSHPTSGTTRCGTA